MSIFPVKNYQLVITILRVIAIAYFSFIGEGYSVMQHLTVMRAYLAIIQVDRKMSAIASYSLIKLLVSA
jgi:hypothetical protein